MRKKAATRFVRDHMARQTKPLLALIYWSSIFALVFASIRAAEASMLVAPFWLPVAVIVAAMMRSPRQRWPAILAFAWTACAAANVALGRDLNDNLFHSLLNVLGAFVAAQGVHSSTQGVWHFSARSMRDFAISALTSSALMATLASGWWAVVHGRPLLVVWPEWFFSNAFGLLIGTPFILSWSEPALRPRLSRWAVIEIALLGVAVFCVTYIGLAGSLPMMFIAFPMLAAVTARAGVAGATVSVLAFASATLWCMSKQMGPLAAVDGSSLFVKMLLLRTYLLTGVLATLPVALVLTLRGLLDQTMDNMIQGLAMFDRSNRLIVCNRRFAEIYGLAGWQTARGTLLTQILDGDGRPVMRPPQSGRGAELIADRSQVELPDERIIEVQYRILPGETWISTHEDVTEKRRADRRIAHLANHDPLTDLANRSAFRAELDRHIAAIPAGESFAIHSIDLDRFKAVNDTLGHAGGDELLRQVAQRLREETRNSDFIARLGGDEFAIIQAPLGAVQEAESLATRIVEAVSWPFEINGHEARIGASVGIAHAPLHGTCQAELLQKSDIALYRSKSDGRNCFCIYEAGMDALLQERRQLEIDLRAAIQLGQFVVHYQPLFNVDTGAIAAVEALVRWDHPTRGLLAPSEFISIAEETGLIVPIGEWVLRHACYEAARWPTEAKLAVNFSPVQLKHPNLLKLIMSALASAGLPPSRFEIEITENQLLEDTEELLALLNELHALGISIAMDDFGTGYSSLSYLRTFPFDKIKIDQSFVKDIGSNDEAEAIVQATTQLSQQLGMRTTAEGVETSEQLELLRQQGCTEVQGFYFSAPVASDELESLFGAGGDARMRRLAAGAGGR